MLDPNTVQVLFADLQLQIVARSKTNRPEALARSAAVLAQVARLLHLPVHLSVVPEGGQRPELIPELTRETEGAAQFLRVSASPFLDEATRAAIAATGRQHLVIAGFGATRPSSSCTAGAATASTGSTRSSSPPITASSPSTRPGTASPARSARRGPPTAWPATSRPWSRRCA
jgi:hypothetical protein